MFYHLYVVDLDGNEISGSRRDITRCRTPEDVARIERQLRAATGDDCDIRDNVPNWTEFWRARQEAKKKDN